MIKKIDFIRKFLQIIEQELNGKLPKEGILEEMIEKSLLVLKRRFQK